MSRINIYLPDDFHGRLQTLIDLRLINVSAICVEALRSHVDRHFSAAETAVAIETLRLAKHTAGAEPSPEPTEEEIA